MARPWNGEATITLTGLNIPIMKTRLCYQTQTLLRLMRQISILFGAMQSQRRPVCPVYLLELSDGSDFCSIMLPQVRHLNSGRFLSPFLNSTKSQSSRLSLCFGFEIGRASC